MGSAMISFPYVVSVIPKSVNQQFRVRIVQQGSEPLTRLELLERNRNGEFRARPGTPGVPGRLTGAVAAAFAEAERLIGGAA